MRTAEQIAAATEHRSGSDAIRHINNFYRRQDESQLAPVHGRFNATELAIRRIRRARAQWLYISIGIEYCYALEAEISAIVNGQ
jgi:hypothetical protein